MNIETVKLVCFSPTGTSRTVIESVARGLNPERIERIDITTPDARIEPLITLEHDLIIIGVPVYMGRIPALLTDWLNAIQAENTPAVCVVVYGNRVYDDALLELRDFMIKGGCIPIAGAAFIGEHSFSSPNVPTAHGRPDAEDIHQAIIFGQKIQQKLQNISDISRIPDVQVPGVSPYRGDTTLWTVDFLEVSDDCTQCGICAEKCPVGAIDSQNSRLIQVEKCITCCACMKNCPEHARTMKPGLVKDAQVRLHTLYSERKNPEIFI